MVTQQSLGSLVRRYRRQAELTQEALAELAGISVRAVRDIETGSQHRPRRDAIQLLLTALGAPEEEQAAFWSTAGQFEATDPDRARPHEVPALPGAQVLTILIADMRGYTAYTVQRGDEAGAQLAAQFGASTRVVVEEYGGVVLELRGDEVVCLFASARQALRASVALEEQYRRRAGEGGLPLGVGIGLDAGEIVPVEAGYRGRALNLAARLCSLAAGGDVLVSAGVLHLAGETEGVDWVARGLVTLKGLPGPVEVFQVGKEGALPSDLPDLQPRFDVFLSCSSTAKADVEHLAHELQRAGLEPWLDVWRLEAGTSRVEQLVKALDESRACAVFIGPPDIGDWARDEYGIAQDRAACDPSFRLFPVLLPGLPDPFDFNALPPFLRTRTAIDLRRAVDDDRAVELLVRATKGLPLGVEAIEDQDDAVCPYRGLEAFDEAHAEFFFGRDADVQHLIEKLKESRFLAVLGPSGAGKSSADRAPPQSRPLWRGSALMGSTC